VSESTLAGKILALTAALAEIPHAFGGAIALAYYAEPRATIDIDLNVFVDASRLDDVVRPLAVLGVALDGPAIAEVVQRDGQVRVFWDVTPVDLFFSYDPFHRAAASHRRSVPFSDKEIPILAPEHLIVCKAIFNRPKDWVDIDAMLEIETVVDAAEVLRWVGRIAGDDDQRFDRVAAVLTRRPR
jgi:Nucleotidyl transferase AbiEii toxin, Type IV TA system